MAWLAVDDDGTEIIFDDENYPYRNIEQKEWKCKNEEYVDIPKGSIEKLIGRKLTWEDEPVELKGE